MRVPWAALSLVFTTSCAPGTSSPVMSGPSPSQPTPSKIAELPSNVAPRGERNPPSATERSPSSVKFLHDDVPSAMMRARREGKALFVDAWAAWCHTCLSMQHYVFNDPSLSAFEERVVFLALDTERPQNAAFLARHVVSVWPTFFVIDASNDTVVGYWPGAASLREMKSFLSDAVDAIDASRNDAIAAGSPLGQLLLAKAFQAKADHARAAELYEKASRLAPANWPRRSEALVGWVQALFRLGRAEPCVETGIKYLNEVSGAATPADYTHLVFECTRGLKSAAKRQAARRILVARLREITLNPSAEMSADDRADALNLLAGALGEMLDVQGARAAHEQRLVIMEEAASKAPSPEAASTYDYGRASAYLALGRAENAVRMLEEREKQLPDSYEPPARLSAILAELRRWPEALAAIDRALPNAYGPRRLRYLALKARIQQALNDHRGALATLDEEIRGHRELSHGHASASGLDDAKNRRELASKKQPRAR